MASIPDFDKVMKVSHSKYIIAIVSAIALSNCAVKTYPRPVTAKEKLQTNIAHTVDDIGAVAHHYILAAGPRYDTGRQVPTITNYEFYYDPAFIKDPDKFYLAPEGLPEVTQELMEDTEGYKVYFLTWPSQYFPRNPEFAPLYERYVENHRCYAVYYRSNKGNRGALVSSHGWTGGDVRKDHKVENPERHLSTGYDMVYIQQPYHGLRMPASSEFSGEYFLSGELARMNEAICQAVTDVRSMVNWLRKDYQVVGVIGASLGGIVTLCTAMVEDNLDMAIALVPPSSLGDIPEDTRLAPYVVKGIRQAGLEREDVQKILYVSSPANYPPDIPVKNILIIAGMGDNFVPPDQPKKVWEAWGYPNIHWYPGGHILHFQKKKAMRMEEEFLKDHLPR
jgi:pimeloyl-ACP methyl ester carboxylesterase